MRFFDDTQIHKLLITAKNKEDRYLALCKLAVTTGMRQGELLGLKWTDLDWHRRTIKVERQLKRKQGGGFKFSPPKSKAGIRTIIIGQDTIKMLREHQERLYLASQFRGRSLARE